jgi:4-methyl-5(b-hydroxyethyl)-thiazole monophosphate biosynthesis
MVYLFLADGFEEIEALAPVDLLRRAGKQVIIAGVSGKEITGRNDIKVTADIKISEIVLDNNLEMLILPGGMPGVTNLYACEKVKEAVKYCAENNIIIAAICAAPSILGKMGLLKGVKATCYPGFEKELDGAELSCESVVIDGKFITAKGAGVSVGFALKLVEMLCDTDTAEKMSKTLQCD